MRRKQGPASIEIEMNAHAQTRILSGQIDRLIKAISVGQQGCTRQNPFPMGGDNCPVDARTEAKIVCVENNSFHEGVTISMQTPSLTLKNAGRSLI